MTGKNLPTISPGFGRAAEKLADTVRHVVDLAAGPDRIVAKAIAQAEADIILADGRARAHDIEARAVDRLRSREARRQRNIESIAGQANKALPPPDQVSEEPVSEDWTSRFFDECQDISDTEMQKIWARILAGEVARPKSFAPRTLSIVRDMTKEDAQLFEQLCCFVWFVPGAGFAPIIHDVKAEHVTAKGIRFINLTHLAAVGLIEFNSITGFVIERRTTIAPLYCGRAYSLQRGSEGSFPLGKVIFTTAGAQLFAISNAEGDDDHRVAALSVWKEAGWIVPDAAVA